MIRLLMLNSEFPPIGGGTATANYELLKQLAGRPDIHIDLITSGTETISEEIFAKNITIHRVPIHKKNIHHFRNRELLEYTFQAYMLARKLCKKNQYQLTLTFCVLPAGFVALLLKRKFKIPYVVRISGGDIPGFYRRYKHIYPVMTPMMRFIWRRSDRIITKCSHESHLFLRADSQPKILSIPNGVRADQFTAKTSYEMGGALRILCVARHTPHKGHIDLLNSVRTLQGEGIDLQLILAGDGSAIEQNKLLAKHLGIDNIVEFLGSVSRSDMPSLYRKADVFVLPSFNEGMSNAILEAMASGLPILTTTGCADGLVEHGVNGFVFRWQDAEELVLLLKKFAKDRGQVKAMGLASAKLSQTFTWRAVADQYLQLFSEYEETSTNTENTPSLLRHLDRKSA